MQLASWQGMLEELVSKLFSGRCLKWFYHHREVAGLRATRNDEGCIVGPIKYDAPQLSRTHSCAQVTF